MTSHPLRQVKERHCLHTPLVPQTPATFVRGTGHTGRRGALQPPLLEGGGLAGGQYGRAADVGPEGADHELWPGGGPGGRQWGGGFVLCGNQTHQSEPRYENDSIKQMKILLSEKQIFL